MVVGEVEEEGEEQVLEGVGGVGVGEYVVGGGRGLEGMG